MMILNKDKIKSFQNKLNKNYAKLISYTTKLIQIFLFRRKSKKPSKLSCPKI